MGFTSGEIPDKPTVHRAKQNLTARCPGLQTGAAVQNPTNFGAGEVWVNQQAGFAQNQIGCTVGMEFVTQPRCTTTLPDNGVADGLACGLFPDDGGFPLVCDTDGGDVCGAETAFFIDFRHGQQFCGEDLHRIMLYPSGSRVMLRNRILRPGNDLAASVKEYGPG